MNIKIQGGGNGVYANNGSSSAVIKYLEHEDKERKQEGKEEYLFTHDRNRVLEDEAVFKLDHNKRKLCNKDAKFYVLTVSPSQEEIKALGETEAERSKAFKEYIRKDIMQKYAENFNKNLNASDMMYYAKIHHTRGNKEGDQMHAHIVISRKDIHDNKKISPMTNHRNGAKSGTVQSGFDRENFVQMCEISFDKRVGFERDYTQSFEYLNTIKNGTIEEIEIVAKKLAEQKVRAEQSVKEQNKVSTIVSRTETFDKVISDMDKSLNQERPIPIVKLEASEKAISDLIKSRNQLKELEDSISLKQDLSKPCEEKPKRSSRDEVNDILNKVREVQLKREQTSEDVEKEEQRNKRIEESKRNNERRMKNESKANELKGRGNNGMGM